MFDKIACSNANSLWGAVVAEVLQRLGLRVVVISPGSRSTPLTFALARHSQIETVPVLDERSASFFALGLARRTNIPVALVSTSGTAVANFFPAVIEAHESRVPLLVLTADRPPEMRNCRAGQTIDQVKIYGKYPSFQAELAMPSGRLEHLRHLRQTLVYAWERTQFPFRGPVHLNFPFSEPLSPETNDSKIEINDGVKHAAFFSQVRSPMKVVVELPKTEIEQTISELTETKKGLIVIGPHCPVDAEEFADSIGKISRFLNWPVMVDALGPLRNFAKFNPFLISNYDSILRNKGYAKLLSPECVLSVGPLPTSKVLRAWLDKGDAKTWLVDCGPDNVDSLHRGTIPLRIPVETLAGSFDRGPNRNHGFLKAWMGFEKTAHRKIIKRMQTCTFNFEGRVAYTLSKALPRRAVLIVANSMSVRDMEYFWQPNNSRIKVYCNRGANGIDGTLSTAIGIAHGGGRCFLLTGDLAFLHDINALLLAKNFTGWLTIVLVNNQGGGIFENLPIAAYDPPFEDHFAMPQNVDFSKIAIAFGIGYERVKSMKSLPELLIKKSQSKIRILEMKTDRKRDTKFRRDLLEEIAEELGNHRVS